jgi:hypothetical protein
MTIQIYSNKAFKDTPSSFPYNLYLNNIYVKGNLTVDLESKNGFSINQPDLLKIWGIFYNQIQN